MTLMRWDPFGEMLKMQRDMDRMFSRMGTGQDRMITTATWMPRLNAHRSGDELLVDVELAGIKPEDVDISVTDGVLSITGERRTEEERTDEGWLVRESGYGSFERSMALPEGVDPTLIRADLHDGMLELHIPKALGSTAPETTHIAIGSAPEAPELESTSKEAKAA